MSWLTEDEPEEYDEYDESSARVRPNPKGNKPRTKTRPGHADSVSGRVYAVDRGRFSVLVGEGTRRRTHGRRDEGARTRALLDRDQRLRQRGGRHDGRRGQSCANRERAGTHHPASSQRRRHRCGRTHHRRQRRPDADRGRRRQSRAATAACRPLPGCRVRRRHHADPRDHEGRPAGSAASSSPTSPDSSCGSSAAAPTSSRSRS